MKTNEEKPSGKSQDEQPEQDGLDRRKFLKTTSALGAGLALGASSCMPNASPPKTAGGGSPPPAQPPAVPLSKPWVPGLQPQPPAAPSIIPVEDLGDDIHLAVIGCGIQGRVLMASIRKEPIYGVRIKAICDILPYHRKYAESLLTKIHREDVLGHAYEDYRELLATEKNLHAAIIATPDWMHAEQAIACMKAGLHVYCEKPMSNDPDQARRMLEISRETGRELQIGFQRRSNPRYRFAVEHLLREARLLGPITHARTQWNRSVCTSHALQLSRQAQPSQDLLAKFGYDSLDAYCNWRWYRKHGGGPFSDLAAQQIDVLNWFLDARPSKVVVNGGRDYWGVKEQSPFEWYDNVLAVYEFPTLHGLVRAQCQVLSTSSAMGYCEGFMGTDGALSISENPTRCWLHAEGYLQSDRNGNHPWTKWEAKGYIGLTKSQRRYTEFEDDASDGSAPSSAMTDILRMYTPTPLPPQYAMNLATNTTLHGPHLRNFFRAIRGREALNCSGQDGYACAVQTLKVNQLLDAGLDAGRFAERDFQA